MKRVFSGIQPSGELHLGNYLGAVQNWVKLQTQHDCLFCVVDLHAITQPYEPANLSSLTLDMAVSLYAAGLDPEKCIVFVQSHVPEHNELNWLLTTVAPLGELRAPDAVQGQGAASGESRLGCSCIPCCKPLTCCSIKLASSRSERIRCSTSS
jgi:tryptophanyl-tRNA synthetase